MTQRDDKTWWHTVITQISETKFIHDVMTLSDGKKINIQIDDTGQWHKVMK